MMRELTLALSSLENALARNHGVSFNEAMVLCAIGHERVSASFVSEHTGFSPSNTSKIIGALERKSLLTRALGEKDKRSVLLSLTPTGTARLAQIKAFRFDIPPVLEKLFQ